MRKTVFAVPEQQRRRSDCTVGHCSYRQVQVKFKDFSTVFKDLKLMQNSDLSVKILLQKC